MIVVLTIASNTMMTLMLTINIRAFFEYYHYNQKYYIVDVVVLWLTACTFISGDSLVSMLMTVMMMMMTTMMLLMLMIRIASIRMLSFTMCITASVTAVSTAGLLSIEITIIIIVSVVSC